MAYGLGAQLLNVSYLLFLLSMIIVGLVFLTDNINDHKALIPNFNNTMYNFLYVGGSVDHCGSDGITVSDCIFRSGIRVEPGCYGFVQCDGRWRGWYIKEGRKQKGKQETTPVS
jgi:hypothetical protein